MHNRYTRFLNLAVLLAMLVSLAFAPSGLRSAQAAPPGTRPMDLSAVALPYTQNWSNTTLLTVNDDWSGVPGVMGYQGTDLTTSTGTDPQSILADNTTVDLFANQTNPNTFTSGGPAEFEITDPVVALQGSGTADAPFLLFSFSTLGLLNIDVAYDLRDIDGSTDNAVQPVALQYRVGGAGSFTNIPAGFVADASNGPDLADRVTPVSVTLPAAADNQPLVQVRVITANAVGSDEWIGVDNISINGEDANIDYRPTVLSTTPADDAIRVALDADITINFSEPVSTTAEAFSLECEDEAQTFAFTGNSTSVVLNPDQALDYYTACTVTVSAALVSDQDEPVETMETDYTFTFTTLRDPDAIVPIGEARAEGVGFSGWIQGNVTTPTGIFNRAFSIQDDTGGMYIYYGSLTVPDLSLGDLVQVQGTIKNYSGMLEIDPTTQVVRVGGGATPAAQAIATSAVAANQGKLVEVTGTVNWTGSPTAPGASHFTFSINDGSGAVNVYINRATGLDMTGFVLGQTMRVTGISGAFNTPQILPRFQADLVDLRPPAVTGTLPASDATGVSLYKSISATFSKAMNPASLTGTTFTVSSPSGPVTGVVAYDEATRTATFIPSAILDPLTVYTATLTMGVEDSLGIHLQADYEWSFTTGDQDLDPPAIVSRAPDAGAVDVPVSSAVVITFSEELREDTVIPAAFTLTGPYGSVPVTVSYDPVAFAVTLTPTGGLLPTRTYTVHVDDTLADLAGNVLSPAVEWSFTTAVEPPMLAFFGDVHNHTSYSDGTGTPTQALAAGKAAGFDFMAISDHSYAIDDAEWASTLDAVESATGPDFVALRGFEYTQGAEGHINVWNSVRHAVRANTGCTFCDYTPNLEAGATVNGFYPWLASDSAAPLDASGIVMQFNHPGWINFNDWKYHAEVSGVARLEEVGNGSGTSYVFSEEEYIRSLDYGWKVGATNNADTHSAQWGTNTDHRTGVLMPELTKAALMDALRARRTFATEDKNFALSMKANGSWMGSEISNTGAIQFEIEGDDPDGEVATLVELITDQGVVLNSYQPTAAIFTWQPLETITAGVHYFYVKVTQADGDRIVTSPVWTLGTEDISITDVVIQPTIPTIHNPSLITARITNRVAAERTVSALISVNGVPLGAAQEVTLPANGDGYVIFNWQPVTTGEATLTAEILNAPAEDNPDDNSFSLEMTITDERLPLILIDAGHGNLNATANEMKSFVDDLSAHQYNVLKNLDTLTAEDLNPEVVKLLIITAPETAYSEAERTAIGNFVNAGGSLWIGGLADYTGSIPCAATVADRENAILDTIETVTGQTINMRMNDDEIIDADDNNGYVFGVIWGDFPAAESTGIGMNVEKIATWSLSSIRGRTVNDPLTAETPGVQIVMQGDLDEGYGPAPWHNSNHTSNESADDVNDAYIYNPTWTYPAEKPANAIPVPAAAVTDLPGTAGRIMLYGDSNDPFTTFAYTAGDGKQNELFNLQSVMWLLGNQIQKSTVAEARAQAVEDQPDNLGKLVWVEGEITAAYGEFFNVLTLRDETGGITVHAPAGDIYAGDFTRGTKVRAIGTVGIYNGDTEIEFFEAEMVQVIEASAGEPRPQRFSTYQAGQEANEGRLVMVTGRVTGMAGADTLYVNDGSGVVRVFLDGYNGSFDDIELNDRVRVVGLASEDGDGPRIRARNYKAHAGIADDVAVLLNDLYLPLVILGMKVEPDI